MPRIASVPLALAVSLLLASVVHAQELSRVDLENATYTGIYDEEITLVDGRYAGALYSDDSSARPRVELLERGVARGDLDGDGVEDAVVLLEESGGGTGRFLHVAAVVVRDGAAVNVATTWIGDRIPVRNVAVEGGRIVLDLVVEGEGDAACCKFTKVRRVLKLQDGEIVTISDDERGLVALSDLEGSGWRLRELGLERVALDDVVVTLELQDGRFIGSGGCNRFQASVRPAVSSEVPVEIEVGPVLATRVLCEPLIAAQEDEYLAKLETSYLFGWSVGALWLRYPVDAGVDRLLFERYAVPEGLIGETWQWTAYADPVEGTTEIDEPSGYRLTFGADDRLVIDTDCFDVSVPFVIEAQQVSIAAQGVEPFQCPETSPVHRLVRDLPWVRHVAVEGETMRLELFADGGVLSFLRLADE